ncbi:unnamed protein product [Lactuca saligna]|uniref:Uncharacterized protein n=1 Tax=Lactuca saligna TaxID=75948 RepID=A0AA35UTT7_LACSI|nr:unnamed protein product [Lactuca saligna]
MILENEGKTIFRYNENENLPNVEGVGIGSETYIATRWEVYDQRGHHNLRADLVEHIFNARTSPVIDDFVEDDLFDDTDIKSILFEGDSDEKFDGVPNDDD